MAWKTPKIVLEVQVGMEITCTHARRANSFDNTRWSALGRGRSAASNTTITKSSGARFGGHSPPPRRGHEQVLLSSPFRCHCASCQRLPIYGCHASGPPPGPKASCRGKRDHFLFLLKVNGRAGQRLRMTGPDGPSRHSLLAEGG